MNSQNSYSRLSPALVLTSHGTLSEPLSPLSLFPDLK